MRVLITGAHFTPAQAVIEQLLKDPSVEIVYVGRRYTREGDRSPSVESQILPDIGVRFIPIAAGRLQRVFTPFTILSLLKIPIGFLQSFLIILKEKPDVVVSFGGYVAVPVVIVSWLLSIPILIHEQTLVSGLANQISSIFADKIAVSYPLKEVSEGGKTVLTGNPIRKEIIDPSPLTNVQLRELFKVSQKEKLSIILVTGGNQGSHIINETVAAVLEDLTRIACVVHQTGDSKFQDYEKLVKLQQGLRNPERYLVSKWIEANDFAQILSKADLVISRAGANTLLELAHFGVPTLVIPIPYLYKNEQMTNAKFFASKELVKILPQTQLSPEKLLFDMKEMLKNLVDLKSKAQGAKDLVIPDAAKRVALEAILLAKKE